MESATYQKIIHDSKVFKHELLKVGQGLNGVCFDTFISAYLLHPTNKSYDLAELEELFLNKQSVISLEGLLGKGKSQKNMVITREDKKDGKYRKTCTGSTTCSRSNERRASNSEYDKTVL